MQRDSLHRVVIAMVILSLTVASPARAAAGPEYLVEGVRLARACRCDEAKAAFTRELAHVEVGEASELKRTSEGWLEFCEEQLERGPNGVCEREEKPVPPVKTQRPKRVRFFSGVGLGVLGLATIGVGIGLQVRGTDTERTAFSGGYDNHWEREDQLKESRRDFQIAKGLFVLGSLLAVAGLLMMVIPKRKKENNRTRLVERRSKISTFGLEFRF